MISAFYNFRGLALFELGNKEQAKLAFEKSVASDTSFLLAKINLNIVTNELITEKNNEKSKTPTNNNITPELVGDKNKDD